MVKEKLIVTAIPGARDGQRVLQLKGSLNIQTVFTFQDVMKTEMGPALVLDFSDVDYIDSAGLGALVAAHVGAQRGMRKLAFAGMNTQVKALMDMTHVSQLFKAYPTVKDAEAALA
ncbi:MAG TPA: STAS domain-containing protein [Candidatus Acidoferrales bacterium]|jgi:anti-sigma B factor antagonist|nr:STAS domain-containing protein [Candidatus Acidoferrales bacterium]